MGLARFCPLCAAAIEELRPGAGRCRACGKEVFANPKPTAGVFLERAGRLLLVRRGAEPARGRWDIPGGFLDQRETPEACARREIREELGIELDELQLVAADLNDAGSEQGGDAVLDLLYEARDGRGEPRAGSDAAELGWFGPGEFPDDLAFPATRRLLEGWARRRNRGPLRLLGGETLDLARCERIAGFGPEHRPGLPELLRPECGEWQIHDGVVCGRVAGEAPAAAWIEAEVEGDHLLAFRAHTVAPACNDINAYWEGAGRILGDTGQDIACTIAGVAGWWDGLWGLERHPEGGLRATARRGGVMPGRAYAIVGGRRGASDFLFVDGDLVMQVDDPGAPRRLRSRAALATWNGHLHVLEAALYRLPPA